MKPKNEIKLKNGGIYSPFSFVQKLHSKLFQYIVYILVIVVI